MVRSVPLSRSTLRAGGGSAFFVRPQASVMRFSPTSKEWLVLIRRGTAFGAGFVVWLFCSRLDCYSEAQTGMIVPADLILKREIVGWLWFPFSWLPEPVGMNDFWDILKRLLIGVPYAAIVVLVILWLFRMNQSKKI